MIDLHGIVYAYHTNSALNDLTIHRTGSSLPFGCRYRLIDFTLSAMSNAGVRNVGVIMQRNYQSLIDHLAGGRDWNLSRSVGGLALLPPYGMHDNNFGEYRGCMEALSAMQTYIREIKQNHIILARADIAANIDMKAAFRSHKKSGLEITAICADTSYNKTGGSIRFIPDSNGHSSKIQLRNSVLKEGLASTEIYIINKSVLIQLVDWCRINGRIHFHRDALAHYLVGDKKINLFTHKGYAARIGSVNDYYEANMDMLDNDNIKSLFPEDFPVYTKGRSSVSTYYSEKSKVKNCLVADGCFIEGELENCVVFRGVRVGKGSKLKNCIIMQDTVIGQNNTLQSIISDKDVVISDGTSLIASPVLPLVIEKGKKI